MEARGHLGLMGVEAGDDSDDGEKLMTIGCDFETGLRFVETGWMWRDVWLVQFG